MWDQLHHHPKWLRSAKCLHPSRLQMCAYGSHILRSRIFMPFMACHCHCLAVSDLTILCVVFSVATSYIPNCLTFVLDYASIRSVCLWKNDHSQILFNQPGQPENCFNRIVPQYRNHVISQEMGNWFSENYET